MSGAAVAAFDVEAQMPDAPTSSGSSRSRRVSASSSQTTAHRRLPGHSRSPRTGSSPSSSSNSAPEANSPPAAPQAAAMAASASTASSNRGQKPLPRYSRTQLCLEVLDIISFFSMLAATACGAAFCILVFDAGNRELWGLGVASASCLLIPLLVMGGLVLLRNHWLAVALRYCLSVVTLQRDGALDFHYVPVPFLASILSWASYVMLGIVGALVATYLTICYVVTAVLSVPLLDLSLLLVAAGRARAWFLRGDVVFMDNYKQARHLVHCVVQALPQIILAAIVLSAALRYDRSMATNAALPAAGLEAGTLPRHHRMLLQQRRARLTPMSEAGAAGAEAANPFAGVVAGIIASLTPSMPTSNTTALEEAAVTEVFAVADTPLSGLLHNPVAAPSPSPRPSPRPSPVVPSPAVTMGGASSPAVASKGASPAVSVAAPSPPVGLTAVQPVASPPVFDAFAAAAANVPRWVVYAALITSAVSLLQKLLQMAWEMWLVKVKPGHYLVNTVKLVGGLRVPPELALEAADRMLQGGGGKLWFSDMGLWDDAAQSSTTSSDGEQRRGLRWLQRKLPLVPRYLFPLDGAWLSPGQMSSVASTAFDHYATDIAAITTWEIEHSNGDDLATLLHTGLPRLPQLRLLRLSWCRLRSGSLQRVQKQLLEHPTLREVELCRCAVSDSAGRVLQEAISSSSCRWTRLNFMQCYMQDRSAARVAAGLCANQHLSSVTLTGCNAGRPLAAATATAIVVNPNLRHLNLSFNRLGRGGGKELAAALAGAGQGLGLRRLVVQGRELGRGGLAAVVRVMQYKLGSTGPYVLRPHPHLASALLVEGLPLVAITSEDLDPLLAEAWLEPLEAAERAAATAAAAAAAAAAAEQTAAAAAAALLCPGAPGGPFAWAAQAAPGYGAPSPAAPYGYYQQQAYMQQQAGLDVAGVSQHGFLGLGQEMQAVAAPVGSPHAAPVWHDDDWQTAAVSPTSLATSRMDPSGGAGSSRVGHRHGAHAAGASSGASSSHGPGASSSSGASSSRVCSRANSNALMDASGVRDQAARPADPAAAADAAAGKQEVQASRQAMPGTPPAAAAAAAAAGLHFGEDSTNVSPLAATAYGQSMAAAEALTRIASTGSLSSSSSTEEADAGTAAVLLPGASQAPISALVRTASGSTSRRAAGSFARGPVPQLVLLNHGGMLDACVSLIHNVSLLTVVDLSGVALSGAGGWRDLTRAVGAATQLQQLLLARTELNDEAAAGIGQALGPDHSLVTLDLSGNTVCEAGAVALATSIAGGACPQLQLLALVDNRYPFDLDHLQALQALQLLRPGLTVDLGLQLLHATASMALSRAATGSTMHGTSSLTTAASRTLSDAEAAVGGPGAGLATAGSSAAALDGLQSPRSTASEDLCGVCFDQPNSLRVTGCGHSLCVDCYRRLCRASAMASGTSSSTGVSSTCPSCPFCRGPIQGFRYSQQVVDAAMALGSIGGL